MRLNLLGKSNGVHSKNQRTLTKEVDCRFSGGYVTLDKKGVQWRKELYLSQQPKKAKKRKVKLVVGHTGQKGGAMAKRVVPFTATEEGKKKEK